MMGHSSSAHEREEVHVEALIIGCGVAGLSCGIRLLEAGFDTTIWARELPPNTTSNIAAAIWYPYKAYPETLVKQWGAVTYDEFTQLAQEPHTGVTICSGRELFHESMPDPWWRDAVPSFRRAHPDELPDGYHDGFVFETPVIEMDVYLPYLIDRFQSGAGVIEIREVRDLSEAFAEYDLVINCAGLGARELVGDQTMVPIRGQIVRVARGEGEEFLMDEYGPLGVTYIVPRSTDYILGGVAEGGNEALEPDPATAAAIIERCSLLLPALRTAPVIEHRVGLRPGRPAVRLEAEDYAPGKLLVHNYGHGGAGVTLSWGCADECVQLVKVKGKR
jgi:D-amino-acid oxidase